MPDNEMREPQAREPDHPAVDLELHKLVSAALATKFEEERAKFHPITYDMDRVKAAVINERRRVIAEYMAAKAAAAQEERAAE